MDRQDSNSEPILSPIQMVDLDGYKPQGELKPVSTELIRKIAEESNAHSAIVITATELLPGQPGSFQVAQFNCGDKTFEAAINHVLHVLTNMVEGMKEIKPE